MVNFLLPRRKSAAYEFVDGVNAEGKREYRVIKDGKVVITVHPLQVAATEREISAWYTYLNTVFGTSCFGLALAAQGTPNVSFNSWLALVFMFLTHYQVNKFPPRLTRLRKHSREDLRYLARQIEKRQLGTGAVFKRASIFFLGYFYLSLVAVLATFPNYSALHGFAQLLFSRQ